MSRTRDLGAAIAALVAGGAIAVLASHGSWSPEAVFVAGVGAMVVIGTLAWHVDWSRLTRGGRS